MKSLAIATLVVLTAACAAAAEPVFFDDFDDPDLGRRWLLPPRDHWDYEVSGGMLHVNALHYPSHPKSGVNWATMWGSYEAQTEFRTDVWMGWDPGDGPHQLELAILAPTGHIIAAIGYRNADEPGTVPEIYAASGASDAASMPAPEPGMYRFTIARSDGAFSFSFGGERFATFPDRFGMQTTQLRLDFTGPYPGPIAPFHVDRVVMVPSPAVAACFMLLALGCGRSRATCACSTRAGLYAR